MARASTMSAKDKYERQKELARERTRKYRARLSEEKKEAKKKYDRDRIEKLKNENKIKTIKDMTPREQRKQRKYWRDRNRIRRLKQITLCEVAATPPSSPEDGHESNQKKRGRKQVRRDKAKAYRIVEKQKQKIQDLERKLEKYKKRIQREKQKNKTQNSPSPRKQVAELIRGEKVSPIIRKQLFLGCTFRKQIKSQVRKLAGTKKNNQILRKVIGNEILKKYRVQKYFTDVIPYAANKTLSAAGPSPSFKYVRKTRAILAQSELLIKFFEDDRVSRMCPGKRDVVKKGAARKQRRILLEPLKTLHLQFMEENNTKISLSSFLRARPFWVTLPKMSDRETCGCIKHSNMELLLRSLKIAKVIKEATTSEAVKAVVCSTSKEECMMSTCDDCKQKEINFFNESDFKLKYFQWKTVREVRLIKQSKKIVQKTMKVMKIENIAKVKIELKKQMMTFKKHVFYYKHQAQQLKNKVENVEPEELIFRIDFSENYVCKYEKEIQAVHFGASKRQLALNTGLVYFQKNGKPQSECFASVSNNLDHQAHAVWGHMTPILKNYSSKFPNTKTVTFFSDGPSNQYRNRFNIKLFQTIVPKYFHEITKMTWNYTEAGHGKGPMDGVGGTLKRTADRKVLYGTDITCAKDFIEAVSDIDVFLVEIPEKDIINMKNNLLSLKVPAIEGIMKVHQITYSRGIMFSRYLSCFECPPSVYCEHFTLSEVFPDDADSNNKHDEEEDRTREEHPITKELRTKKAKLSVDDIYSSSDDEQPSTSKCPVPPKYKKMKIEAEALHHNIKLVQSAVPVKDKIASGQYVLVRFEKDGKKSQTVDFIGVCQTSVCNDEVSVMFMKTLNKDTSLYVYDEQDVSSVHISQIVKVLPSPTILLKGMRAFYKFK